MFTSERVRCYLNGFSGHGDDADDKELKLVFFVAPISRELAAEISPYVADRLFRLFDADDKDGEWVPARELTKASFASVNVPMQNLAFHPFPEPQLYEDAPMIPGAAISNLRASRDKEDGKFRLEFDVVIPMDGMTMDLVEKYYKSSVFLTMTPVQKNFGDEESVSVTVEEQANLQDAADGEAETGETEAAESSENGKGKRRRRSKAAV